MNEMCISNIKNGKYFLSVFLRLYLVCFLISSYRNLNYITVVYAGVEELSTVASASCRRGNFAADGTRGISGYRRIVPSVERGRLIYKTCAIGILQSIFFCH